MKEMLTVLAAGLLLLLGSSPAAPAGGGSPDKSFSGDGRVKVGFRGAFDFVGGRDVFVTSSGKVVTVVALDSGGEAIFGVVRLRKNGSPDPSFSDNGRRTTTFTGRDVPRRVIGRGNGRILTGGSAGDAFGLASYRKNGSLDSTFDGDGKVITDVSGGADQIFDLRVEPDGKILAAGLAGDEFAVVRYLADGTPDPTFGDGGVVLTTDGFEGVVEMVRLQPDGKLLAVGASESNEDGVRGVAVSRFDTDGSLDETFGGGDGRVSTFLPERELGRALAVIVQPDGRILVGGRSFGEGDYARFLVARYLPGGTLDGSFSGDGVVEHFVQPYYCTIHSLALQPDGKIVAAGWTDREGAGNALAITRYRPGGALDKSFSGNGMTYFAYGDGVSATAYAVTVRGGRIVAAGEVTGSGVNTSNGVAIRLNQ
jgi:uncharacterized delta-60 repeat protein